jgi:hypothetical protein
MADIVVVPASVLKTTTTQVRQGTAGAAITAGEVLYSDSTDSGKWKPAIATAAITAEDVVIALNDAATDQPIFHATSEDVTFNAVLAVGTVYVVSAAAAGGIAPVSDLASGNFPTILGVATTTTNLKLNVSASGVAIP